MPPPVADVATRDLSDYRVALYAKRPYTPTPRGVVGNARPPRNGTRRPRGALRGGKMAKLQLESGILGVRAPPFCFTFFETRLRMPRVFRAPALRVGRLCPPPAARLPVLRGTLRGGKMEELRPVSGILGVRGATFCPLSSSPVYCGFACLAPPLLVLRVNVHAQ